MTPLPQIAYVLVMPRRTKTPQQTVRAVRLSLGIDVQDLAATIGVNPGHLSRVERGERTPSDALAEKIETALGVTAGTFRYPQPDPRRDGLTVDDHIDALVRTFPRFTQDQLARLSALLPTAAAAAKAEAIAS